LTIPTHRRGARVGNRVLWMSMRGKRNRHACANKTKATAAFQAETGSKLDPSCVYKVPRNENVFSRSPGGMGGTRSDEEDDGADIPD